MVRKYVIVSGILFLFLFATGLASVKEAKGADKPIVAGFVTKEDPKKDAVPYVSNFNYSPASTVAQGSAGVTFAIVNVKYQSNMNINWIALAQFSSLDKTFKDDLSKILQARGFSVLGPFASGKVPSADKKAIDLSLASTIELTIGGPPVYRLNDLKVDIDGNIALELREKATHKVVWSKSIPFKLTTFGGPPPWGGKIKRITWKEDDTTARTIANEKLAKHIASVELEPEAMNDIAQAFEKQYSGLMAEIFNAIEPQEMIAIKQQIKK